MLSHWYGTYTQQGYRFILSSDLESVKTMQIRSITVSRTYNIGNYESLKLEISADLESFDSAEASALVLEAKLDTMRANILDKQDDYIPDEMTSPGR
jgi:hypothetical protein